MKLWRLSSQQAVYYSYYRLGFCSKDRRKDLVIRKEQFWNLHDIMRGFHEGSYPLGRSLWLRITKRSVRIENKHICFEFLGKSWKRYKRNIHWRIHSFLRHGRQHGHRQVRTRTPPHHTSQNRSRASSPARQQDVLRTFPDSRGQNTQQSQSSTISKQLDSNPGTTFSFRNAVNELRNAAKAVSSHTNTDPNLEEVCGV